MSEPVEVKNYKGFKIKIFPETEPVVDPRSWDNLGIMECKYKDYGLGDKKIETGQFSSWAEVENHILDRESVVEIYPLYVYEHTLLNIKIGSYAGQLPQGHARFDSSRVGFIYTTEKRLEKIGTPEDKVREALEHEVEIYNYYLRGEVYGYMVEDSQGIQVDNLTGFYGYDFEDNGLLNRAKGMIDNEIEKRAKARANKLMVIL